MKNVISILAVAVFSMGASNCNVAKVRPDSSQISAQDANDATVFLEACDNLPKTGFNFCRVTEGDSAVEKKLTFIVPPVDCADEHCVSIKILFPDGQPAQGYQVKKGQVRLEIPWIEILHRDTFEKADRGNWGVIQKWKWRSTDGNIYESQSEGQIYMRVLSREYSALHNVKQDENFVWKWESNGYHYNLSTAGRAAVWK